MCTRRREVAKGGMGIAVGARDAAKLGPLIDEITALGRPAKAYTVDATVEAQVENFVASAEADLGPAVAAIYNVGRRSMKSILEMESGEFEAVGRASCLGGMVFGREVAARMVPRASGTILFTGGRSSRVAKAGWAGFAVGKFGLRALAQSMAMELSPKGIHVAHVIIEGGIDNEQSRTWVPELAEKEDNPNWTYQLL